MSMFDLFLERKSNHRGVQFNRNTTRGRSLRMESLEERALLSAVPLSAAEYADLRAQYADFNLPENMADLNVITLDLAQGDNLYTLKGAIKTAGTTSKSDLIVVRTSDTANTLVTDELIINTNVTIVGLGSQNFTLDAKQACRVMTISGGTVKLGGLTITNGKSSSYGGGIYKSAGTLTIANSTISGNTVSSSSGSCYGGGIYNSSNTLRVINCTISENIVTYSSSSSSANCYGGGISSSGSLIVTNCMISGNSTTSLSTYSRGGGIYAGTLTITNSTVSGNSANNSSINTTYPGNSQGGGIYANSLTITNSIISGNAISGSATGLFYGGGIYASSPTVTNCTISGNKISRYTYSTGYQNYGCGGGIYSSSGLSVTNCTISGNASLSGSGIYTPQGVKTINNSIIVDNSIIYYDSAIYSAGSISGTNNLSSFTDWTSGSNNLIYDSTKPLFVDAKNGDYHLAPGAQAIDRGNNALAVDANGSALASDQDGIRRIVNNIVDIGAYEYYIGKISSPVLEQPTVIGSTISVSWSSVDDSSDYQFEYKQSTNSKWTTQIVDGTSTTFTGTRGATYSIRVKANAVGSGSYADSDYSTQLSFILNNVPTAVDDIFVLKDLDLVLDVLANDSDPDNDNLSIISTTKPIYGQIAVFENGKIAYLPDENVTTDSFTYTVSDGFGGTSTATVTITAPENEQPVAQDDLAQVELNGYVLIDVLANDSDPDGDTLSVLSVIQPSNGMAVITKDDKILYICNGAPLGDSFTYTVSDGRGGTSTATVTITAPATPLTGLTLSTEAPIVGTEITTTLDPTDATATYQWFADETLIEGEEGSAFTVTEAYIGQTITCVVTGTGNYTGTVSATTAVVPVPVSALDAPAELALTVYNATVTASWSAVENAASYTLEYKPEGSENWTALPGLQDTTASFDGVPGTLYNVRVKANGTGDYSDSDYTAVNTDKPTGPVVAINANKVTVSWADESPAADAVRYRVAGAAKWTLKKLKAGITSLTFNGAVGTNYEIEVLLDQQESTVLSGTAVVLDQPKLKAEKAAIKDDTFQVIVTNYTAKNLAANVTQAILTVNGTMTTLNIADQQGITALANGGNVAFANGLFTFTGMNCNTAYKVQVSFSDGHSVSKASSALSVKTLKAPYLAPVLTSATATSSTSVTVEWETAYGKGTTDAAQYYTVQYSLDGQKWVNATTKATGNSFLIQKLKPGTQYLIAVIATKGQKFDASEPSNSQIVVTMA